MQRMKVFVLAAILILAGMFIAACAKSGTTTPTSPPVVYSVPELKYQLIASFGDVFYVDFDYYPVAWEWQEEKNALEQFPVIRADSDEFSAILRHLGLPDKADYTTEEKVFIYREHKILTRGIEVTYPPASWGASSPTPTVRTSSPVLDCLRVFDTECIS